MKAFGVGCWSFEPVESKANDLGRDPSSFSQAIESTLRSIPTVRNVSATGLKFGYLAGESNEAYEANPAEGRREHVLRRPRFEPHPYTGRIAFDIEVPASFCESTPLLKRRVEGRDQRFEVQIRYTEYFPVVFVTNLDANARGSDGLVIVREFVLSELQLRDAPIQLVVLGPSPFWADMTVTCPGGADEAAAGDIVFQRRARRIGYDELDFQCPSVERESQALEKVFEFIEPELGLYYQFSSWQSRRVYGWWGIQSDLDDLVSLHEAEGYKLLAKRWARAGRLSRRLSLVLVKEETRAAREAAFGATQVEEVYLTTGSRVFQGDLQKKLTAAGTDYPGAQALVSLLDSRRRYDVNLAALIASSTLGGVAGAGLTAMFGGG